MAAASGPVTPQRPLPGGFINTPAPAPTIFAANAASLRQNLQPPTMDAGQATTAAAQGMTPVERAAKTINDTLAQEARFPDMESFITNGISGDYELPTSQAWMPFQKMKQYDIPARLMEQADHSSVNMQMGVFAPLGHAWVALDNCLYLWDYTLPNPDLVGWEDNTNPISAIKLVTPKSGVFIREIEHLIVVVTNAEMILLGVAIQTLPTGAKTVALYNTRMAINVRGLGVDIIESSKKSGRIFFTGNQTEDIYEFQYQQEEGWFRGRTNRICHTKGHMSFMQENMKAVGQYFGPAPPRRTIKNLVIDDTRNLMYSLSNTSEIRVWLIKSELQHGLSRAMASLLQSTGHFTPRTDLLTGKDVAFTSISAIPATEASKLSLMATTNTGCRLYMSATRGYGYQADSQNGPTSMQIQHIRFPPKDPNAPLDAPQPGQPSGSSWTNSTSSVNTTSRWLTGLTQGYRLPPGYWLAFQIDPKRANGQERVFCTAPDSARLKNPQDTSQLNQRFAEFGTWIDLPGNVVEITPLTSSDAGATGTPLGFGNELALQFDQPSAELAIVTNTGIQTLRRRRLVDMFATLMHYGSNDKEGRDGDINRFARTYGRGELVATALAVACGQGVDISSDARLSSITDPEVLEGARKIFVSEGGKPEYNSNAVPDNSGSQLDSVRPSPRHEGMALYISRLVRSIWKVNIIKEDVRPGEGAKLVPTIKLEKLRGIQRELNALSDFLDRNKNSIEGLSGQQRIVQRVRSRQEEIELQGEHRALHSLVQLISSIVEGISFVLVLFDERIEDILTVLSEESRKKARELTFESLFVSLSGRELAKELVKAIVHRNIANGSNVDTVAEALRRRCGSFCSMDDVMIFKAQEQVKRASEAGSQSETGRVLLNESQRLFQKVAASLSMEHLHWATERYVEMSFYAGAIELCLVVASEKDKARRALSWLKDGMPESDDRRADFDKRKPCYDLIFATIRALDEQTSNASAETLDGQSTAATKRRDEAYDVVNSSEDAVFQTCLYDWYVSNGQADRLLNIDTQYVVDYLKRQSQEDKAHADLLWRYHAHHNDYLQAASVQLDLARGFFELSLDERIEYLSRARTNASTRQTALLDSRQSKQQLLREISDLLDVANIQDDILQRMKSEPRLMDERRDEVLACLNGPILALDELFNQYADQASYWDICIMIYQVADHRNPTDIKASWQSLIDQTDDKAIAMYGSRAVPWEAVGEKVRDLGRRLNVNDATFPVQTLLPMLERYALLPHEHKPSHTWAIEIFLELDIPHDTLLPVLEQIYYGNEHPFTGSKRKVIANQMIYLLRSWYTESERRGERIAYGSEENSSIVLDCVASLVRSGDLDPQHRAQAEDLVAAVNRAMR